MREVYLRVGEKAFAGGPRLTVRGVGFPPQRPAAEVRVDGHVRPARGREADGAELTFHDTDGNSKPGARFAKLELTEKDVKAAAVPLRVAIRETGKFSDPLDDNREVHYLVLAANFYPPFTELRVGEAKPRRFPYNISLGEGKGWRALAARRAGRHVRGCPARGRGGAAEVQGRRGVVQGGNGRREAEGEEVTLTPRR